MKNNKFLISVPYIYPVCPLSIDHAKIMLVADINARTARTEGKEVFFPIAAHYSGVTAEKTLDNLNSEDENIRNKERDKFTIGYKTPRSIVESFIKPEDILDYYTCQTLYDLKRLNISCNYNDFYKTNDNDYEIFVKTIFENYEKNNVLIKNKKDELALNYDDENWISSTKETLNNLNIIHPSLKTNIISSISNIRSDWGILRNYGIGVQYKDGYVIDPMFDSELFVLFDLYKKFNSNKVTTEEIFKELMSALKDDNSENSKEIKQILEWLPTDLFVCEEHLKNWVIKKTFAENLLFEKKYRTNNYFITGMGYINGKRMSSSRGTAILLKDLIDSYGTNVTRMIIMFTGGHPSKMYNYSNDNIKIINKLLNDFYNHINYINSKLIDTKFDKNDYTDDYEQLNKMLKDGFYQQLLVEILKNLPKRSYNADLKEINKIKNTISYFLNILLPNMNV